VHPEFAESLRAARAAGIIGAEVFIGKKLRGCVLAMNKAWAMKFKYAVLAGVNEPKKSCHGVRKARAEVAAYADCTESQMMAMFGWTDPKMPAHYIAQASRKKLGICGMEKIVAFDQSQPLDDFTGVPEANNVEAPRGNGAVTFPGNIRKKSLTISMQNVGFWCARRAVAFAANSMAYASAPKQKVSIRGQQWLSAATRSGSPDRTFLVSHL
jgi:hypothetical protein